ncbi:MAG: CRISPR-associated helicase Cas3' [Burkholderiaceae bacterium]|nr:CRISPR-associated helicase Cas3' [Burkholderiaceae bacterium]
MPSPKIRHSSLPPWRGGNLNHSSAGAGYLSLAMSCPAHPFHEGISQISAWGDAAEPLLMAILAHHGRPVSVSQQYLGNWPRLPGYDWHQDAAILAETLASAFPDAFGPVRLPLPRAPGFIHLIAGFTALADWIGSDRRFFEFDPAPGPNYPDHARKAAANALAEIGLDTADLRLPDTSFRTVAGFPAPNPAQVVAGQMDDANHLVILEAETGSGKTEAALWRFARLYAEGAVSGLYFAVPTRAAAHQLHRRVNAALGRMFGAIAPEAVLAIPGALVSGAARGQKLPDFEVRWDDEPDLAPARWAAEHATRFLAATVAVGTVDQAMLAAMEVKHAPMRGAALTRSLLVIDEVHASDDYMTEVIAELLRGHLAAGGYALLMSATLGSRARCRFLETALPSLVAATTTPYPAVWVGGDLKPKSADGTGRLKAVEIQTYPGMQASPVAEVAIKAARSGARVLVIRNTVSAAIATFQAVTDQGGSAFLMQVEDRPALHHSRFAVEDRALLDAAAETALSTKHDRKRSGCIVIGSQTLEQSLDIDADFLLTDLCPVDVLLQRIGRLHRHDLSRPEGFAVPRTIVFCPAEGLEPLTKPGFENGLGGWKTRDGTFHGIYTDLAGLELTMRQIAAHPVWHIPAMNRALVEHATHPEARAAVIAEMGPAWEGYERDLAGKAAAARMVGQLGVLRRDKPFPERFRSDDEKVMTRLGEQGPVLSFVPGTIGPFGKPVTRIVLPAHWVHGPVPDTPLVLESCAGGFTFVLAERTYRYSREGLDRVREASA